MAKRKRRRSKKSGGCLGQLVGLVVIAIVLVLIALTNRNDTNRASTPRPYKTNTAEPTTALNATDTSRPTRAPTNTSFAPPTKATNTFTPTPILITYYVNASQGVNIRECPATNCPVVTVANPGDALLVLDASGEWYQIQLERGGVAYVAAALVSRSKPAVQPQAVQPQSTNRPAAQTTAIPQPVQPTQRPQPTAVPQPTQPSAPGFTCDCSKACGAMASCEEAYFQLNQCGCSARDIDGDGVPCESICSGG